MDEASRFQELVLTNLHSLHNYARLLTRRADEAEDLLQEGLLRAFKHFRAFDPSLSFKPWMFTILKRAHIDRYRRRATREGAGHALAPPPLDDPLYTIPVAPEEILLRREVVEHVREAIRCLPPYFREIVELRDLEGLSYREIAAVVERPIGTVMSRLYRGRNLLRTYLIDRRRPVERAAEIRDGL